MATETAVLGSGCFWCSEAIFQRLAGVQSVTSGYAGGSKPNPTYHEVCSGATGHAEVVQVVFDPAVIPYAALLEIFWHMHDPTTLNRQGNDVGTQYRSVVLYTSEEQRATAEQVKQQVQADFKLPIVTEIAPFKAFYPAEDYHRDYYNQNSRQPYCQVIISPKLQKLREKYAKELKMGA